MHSKLLPLSNYIDSAWSQIASHLVALMSGISSFIFATISAVNKKPLVAKWFWAAGAICLIAACDGAWQDEHRNSQMMAQEKSSIAGDYGRCQNNAQIEAAYTRGLEQSNLNQRQTVDEQRKQNMNQQNTVNNCVVSLGKMNPLINTKTGVLAIQVATETRPSPVRFGSPTTTYWFALVLSANRRINFAGRLKCSHQFKATAPQMSLREAGSGMFGTGQSKPISDTEYVLSNADTGGVWDAADPVYLVATSSEPDIGPCSFTLPQ
jgi:hypothetical protein